MMKVCKKKCIACGSCMSVCPVGAISFVDDVAHIDTDICIQCGSCMCACPVEAIKECEHNGENGEECCNGHCKKDEE